MPRAGDAAVDDAALADRAVLMRAQVRQRADPRAVAKHRNAFAAGRRDDARRLVGDRERRTDQYPTFAAGRGAAVGRTLAPGGHEVQHHHHGEADHQHRRNERIVIRLHDAERDVHHHQAVGDIKRHVQGLPGRRAEEDEPEIMAGRRHQEEDQERRDAERLERKTDELAVV